MVGKGEQTNFRKFNGLIYNEFDMISLSANEGNFFKFSG